MMNSEKSVIGLDVSTRTRAVFGRLNIDTVGQIAERSYAELIALPNVGETTIQEIERILRDEGYDFEPVRRGPESRIPYVLRSIKSAATKMLSHGLSCGECFFYEGNCHRFPPTEKGRFVVSYDDWCGEWRKRP